jgi:enoyl-CoA hydratase/carnithine racemase
VGNYADLLCERQDGIVLLSFNRPHALNAMTTRMARETVAALDACASDRSVDAVILAGAGERAFCAGVDLEEAHTLEARQVRHWFKQVARVYRTILEIDKPVIAALNGIAAGAGFQCALVSDLRVGCTRTRLSQPEIKAGLPSIMGSYWMTLHLPWGLNQELSYTGRELDAAESLRHALLNDLVQPEALLPRARARAQEVCEKSGPAFRRTKARFRKLALAGYDAAFKAAVKGMEASYRQGEAQRIMGAFLARRRSGSPPEASGAATTSGEGSTQG